ncbi:unnamed protein product [Nesidiocoris tenuis]|uniref:Uncharacterized protein n=1 Tax=Nesidiocoris tenuis TaxID=355587 RepID=A0A6H5HPC3_9HEMI|nr:unnamed protein product [Nesidiocoris tenuis]
MSGQEGIKTRRELNVKTRRGSRPDVSFMSGQVSPITTQSMLKEDIWPSPTRSWGHRDTTLQIGTVPPNAGRLVTLIIGTILSLIGFSNCGGRTTTTKKPLTGTTTTTTMKPVTIKCSNETCPSNCRTDPAIIHGFCCNCKLPMGSPKNISCPANLICPLYQEPLCPDYLYMATCCCSKRRVPSE